ncbi:MAG: permease [Thermodesulfobacteriota bacterium]|nr:permease [Thermodesulfobacteriota bacterium]
MRQRAEPRNIKKKEKKQKPYGVYFLSSVLFLYLLLFVFYPANIQKSLEASGHVLFQIFPALCLIILLMGLVNHFVNPRTVSKYVGKGSGIKGWFLAICTGILSHGSIYAWYPLLRDLRKQGMRSALIAVFLYNRAIKIPLLPLMVHYFGIPFVVILTASMIIASIVQGHAVEMIEGRFSNQC